jgi:hypothetical protein
LEYSGGFESLNAGVFGFAEGFGLAVVAGFKLKLFVPGDRPAGVGVKFAFLFALEFVEGLVDQLQGGADGEGATVVFFYGVNWLLCHSKN